MDTTPIQISSMDTTPEHEEFKKPVGVPKKRSRNGELRNGELRNGELRNSENEAETANQETANP